MKLNKLALSVAAIILSPVVANAGVTVTPLAGYHYTDEAQDGQREHFKTGRHSAFDAAGTDANSNNSGIYKSSDVYAGAALGIEITPSTQFQVEYGVSNADGKISEESWDANNADSRFDVEQQIISGNFLVGVDQFTGASNSRFKPYLLVGAGQSITTAKNQQTYNTEDYIRTEDNQRMAKLTNSGKGIYEDSPYAPEVIKAGSEVVDEKNVIGNLGLGAMLRINDALSVRGEGRAIYNTDHDWWEGLALGGLEVKMGSKKAPVAPDKPPVHVDLTPFTPPVKVEEPEVVEVIDNAPVDTDRDGVVDTSDACPNTPMNLVVDARGCPRQVDVEENLKMELRVFFDNNRTEIKEQYKPEIAKVAEGMASYPSSAARIEGHASKTGPSARYNQRLSEARAVAVKSMLTDEFGVNPERVSTQGFGYERPIAPNDTAEGRAMNRRVYAIITGQKTVTVEQTKDMVE